MRGLYLSIALAAACGEGPPEAERAVRVVMPVSTIATLDDSVTQDLAMPVSVDVGPLGVSIADIMSKRIVVLNHDLSVISSFGRPGSGPGELMGPSLVRWAADGSLWVLDQGLGRATHFSVSGRHLGDISAPVASMVPASDDAILVPGGPGGAWYSLLGDSLLASFQSSQPAFESLAEDPVTASYRWVLFDSAPGDGLVLLDNLNGDLMWVRSWKQNPTEPVSVAIPGWFLRRALEKQSERLEAYSHMQGSAFVSLFQDLQMTASDRIWLHAGWSEAIGLALSLDGEAESTLVVSSPDREFAHMRLSVLVNDSTLLGVYETDVRLFRLGPSERPGWTRQ